MYRNVSKTLEITTTLVVALLSSLSCLVKLLFLLEIMEIFWCLDRIGKCLFLEFLWVPENILKRVASIDDVFSFELFHHLPILLWDFVLFQISHKNWISLQLSLRGQYIKEYIYIYIFIFFPKISTLLPVAAIKFGRWAFQNAQCFRRGPCPVLQILFPFTVL